MQGRFTGAIWGPAKGLLLFLYIMFNSWLLLSNACVEATALIALWDISFSQTFILYSRIRSTHGE